MSNLSYIELHPGRTTLSAHDQIGFELGRDFARHRLPLPAPYAEEPSPLRDGMRAGVAAFGARTLLATPHVRRWLQLRLHAWLRGRSVELVQVTPNYLAQIDVAHCPITRVALGAEGQIGSAASIDRVRNDAGYAAGNLALMSVRANHAKGANGYRAARAIVGRIESGDLAGFGGLNAAEWSRIALLCSFVEPLPHADAAALPLLLLPPNRLRLFNPVQALQAFVSQQLLAPGWSRRVGGFEDLLPGKPLKRDFKRFFMALLPRVLEGGKLGSGAATRWAIEDAWRSPAVVERWTEFARQLTATQCESLLEKAESHRLATRTVFASSESFATDGWNLPTRGYVPHGPAALHPGAMQAVPAQQQFAW